MPANPCVPFFKPGHNVTGIPDVAVYGKRAVSATAEGRGGQPHIALPTARGPIFGVVGHDAIAGQEVHVHIGGIVPVLSSADVAANQQVEIDALGYVRPLAAGGVAVGYAVAPGASGTAVPVKLYG